MNLSLLQIILIGSTTLLLYITINARRENRLRLFHAFVFTGGLASILVVSLKPDVLERI